MRMAIKISRQSVIIDNGIEMRRSNSTRCKLTETINFNHVVFVGFFVNLVKMSCHDILALQLQSFLYLLLINDRLVLVDAITESIRQELSLSKL